MTVNIIFLYFNKKLTLDVLLTGIFWSTAIILTDNWKYTAFNGVMDGNEQNKKLKKKIHRFYDIASSVTDNKVAEVWDCLNIFGKIWLWVTLFKHN